MRTLVLCLVRPTTRVPAYASCVGDGSPALRTTGIRRGEARASQVTGPSSSCVLWSNTPPDTIPSLPKPDAGGRCGLRWNPALSASGKTIGFGAAVPRPARSPAHASQIPSLESAPGLLPAQAGSPLAGRDLHPLDDARSFMVASHPPILFDQPCLVAPEFLYLGARAVPAVSPAVVPRGWQRRQPVVLSAHQENYSAALAGMGNHAGRGWRARRCSMMVGADRKCTRHSRAASHPAAEGDGTGCARLRFHGGSS